MNKVKIQSIRIVCPKTELEVNIPIEMCHFYGSEQECDSCGSHGGVDISINCSCGTRHEVELDSW